MVWTWRRTFYVRTTPGIPATEQSAICRRPTELPPENWVTEKKRADLHEIFNCKPGYMSEEEIEWMKEVMSTFTITRIHRDGVYGHDGLPGYPAHLGPCVDRKGHAWLANNIRVLDELPEGDLWAVPPARFAAHEARDSLTAEEKKMLPHHEIFSRKPTPQHPKTYPGARVMTEDEKKTWHSIGVERDPVEEIAVALSKARQEGLSEEKFCKVPGVTVPKLKAYCKAKGLATKGNKPALLSRVWAHAATQIECLAPDEEGAELDSQADDSDVIAEAMEANALAGQSDFEPSGSDRD
eukprot:g41199.t1